MATLAASDFLVIGGGVIGLRVALEAKRRYSDARVTLIDKEARLGLHASGRNSGVLHAGFYYTAGSFKARFTRDGNARLSEYCHERGLRINRCGKLVVAKDASELAVLDELLHRAQRNGVELQELSAAQAQAIEPRAKTHERALYSPSTATVDPAEIVASFLKGAKDGGVQVLTGTAYVGRAGREVLTSRGRMPVGYVMNAAGLYADRVARDFGFAQRYRILPFKGLYLHAAPGSYKLRTNIYPVPDLRTPFLGVHLTVAVDGHVTLGPNAVPALWREQYGIFENFKLEEFLQVIGLEGYMFVRNRGGFRTIALRELPNYYRPRLVSEAASLAEGVRTDCFTGWGAAGIRAQLVDVEEYRLENDFRLEGDERSLHVLNAVSPAFTCAIPFAEFVLDEVARLSSG
ncbi:MAG: FAD-dependent oxidoreductase [Gemmatimonas sp. SM23_52]|nr:MAG: FAD-dependent oxidoreductase [Gemmatimonas sp. SM23_52]